MNKELLSLIIIATYYFSACSDSTAPIDDNTPEVLSLAACNHDSLRVDTLFYKVDGTEVVLPTVFTPNGDGVDDYFYPRFIEENMVISQYSIYTPEEWSDARIMYSTSVVNLEATNGEIGNPWDGMSKFTESPYVADYEGPFRFRFYVTKELTDSTTARITCSGWGCVDKSN